MFLQLKGLWCKLLLFKSMNDVISMLTCVPYQEEFVCEPPMITRHTSKMFVMEGQEVSLRCKSIGDPEPSTHWVSPDGKLIGNTSRTICYENGSLDILKASVKVWDMKIHF